MLGHKCDAEGCAEARSHLLWCKDHYLQISSGAGSGLKSSDRGYSRVCEAPSIDAQLCSVDGCGKRSDARGWCKTHYSRWRTWGDPAPRCRTYVCADCGQHRVTGEVRGRLPKRCSECAGRRTSEMRRAWNALREPCRDARSVPCAGCGKALYGGKGALPGGERRCLDCRRATWTRTCGACKTVFCSKANNTFCSKRCARSVRVIDPLAFRPRPCVDCGAEVRGSGNVAICPECRPERRRESRRAKDRRRRAALYAAKSEPYTLAEIAERDGSRCQLCGDVVAMGKAVPHPDAPTIDHIVPLAGGGDDTRANVWLAHFLCNVRKGTRPLDEALARL